MTTALFDAERDGARLRRMLGNFYFPRWTADAACRADHLARTTKHHQKAGIEAPPFFADEVAQRREGEYEWPAAVWEAMGVCATCPVRRVCLAHAYAVESFDAWGEPVGTNTRRFGVWGGLPGRQRERFAGYTDRLARSEAWFDSLRPLRRWAPAQQESEATA